VLPILEHYLRSMPSLSQSEIMQFLFHALLFRVTGLSKSSLQTIGDIYQEPELRQIIARCEQPQFSGLQKYISVLRGFIAAIEISSSTPLRPMKEVFKDMLRSNALELLMIAVLRPFQRAS
jgi:hypothetical protein